MSKPFIVLLHTTRMFKLFIIFCLAFSLAGCFAQPSLFPSIGPLQESKISGEGEQKILMITISGMLTSSKPSGFVDQLFDRPSLPARLKEELAKAGNDSQVKAILLRINSPGGTVTASDILYHEIRQFKKEHHIPVIASIVDLGTSGGYYLAAAADQIVAHPSTVTGSIGVIMLTLNAKGLLEKIGIEPRAIASGVNKSMGAPYRSMTEEELAIFQGVIDSMYDQFVEVVKTGRSSLSEEEIRQLADGRIYTAAQAKDLGLIDRIGYLEDAVNLAKTEAGLEAASVVTYHRAGGYKNNIYSSVMTGEVNRHDLTTWDSTSLLRVLGGQTPRFMYMWMP